MGLINWIFDFYQQSRIERAGNEAAQLRSEVAMLRNQGGSLNDERIVRAVGELALAVRTVQRLCVEKGMCTEAEFHQRLRAIDLEDGRADGQAPIR